MKYIFLICFVCFSFSVYSQNATGLDIGEQLINSTIKIQASKDTVINGVKSTITSYGTGFFFQFYVGKDTINTIVTNAHVVKRFSRGVLKFNGSKDSKPNYGDVLTLDLVDFNRLWIYHPNRDLAILPLQPLLISIGNKYKKGSFTIS